MSKITKGLRKQAKKEKKAVKKPRKEDKKVDTWSVPPKSPFATLSADAAPEPSLWAPLFACRSCWLVRSVRGIPDGAPAPRAPSGAGD